MPAKNLITACVAWLLFLLATVVMVRADEVAVQHLDRLVSQQQWDQALLLARELDGRADSEVDLTLSLARLARALQQQNEIDEAAEFYQRAVQASIRPAASELSPETVVLVRLAAGAVLTKAKNFGAAIAATKPLLLKASTATAPQKQIAVAILLKIGANSLSTGAASQAAEAYSVALAHANQAQLPTAMLGSAWATAIMRDRPKEAAKKLTDFLDQFPDHPDAVRAARACVECYKQADMQAEATAMQTDLLQRWPDSTAAIEFIRSHRDTAPDLVPVPVADWLMEQAKSDQISDFDVALTVLGLQIASTRQDIKAWGALVEHLATIDQTGQAVSDALSHLSQSSPADAERLATRMIAPQDEQNVTPKGREAACRWAARDQRWSMLAFASEAESLEKEVESRTATVERLMAEALVQTGRTAEALPWWNHLIETHQASDFATLIRCAEAETSVGRDAELASKRIDAARNAAGKDRFQLTLVNLLDAEMAIRRRRFDEARAHLESVVRESDTDRGIRGRGQWLIGETHYLQQDFALAIEAYRRVEGIDPGGIWVSAALVQAGKSFEQLGRPREASLCYGHLLSRFADTTHAVLARRRMAALNETDPKNSSPALRR
ncbi:MAG: tetratricopeptide repeat protein [Rubripirellula sp.]|nr:tetratricopeptide repeat protein [Rubripirellula sp.]